MQQGILLLSELLCYITRNVYQLKTIEIYAELSRRIRTHILSKICCQNMSKICCKYIHSFNALKRTFSKSRDHWPFTSWRNIQVRQLKSCKLTLRTTAWGTKTICHSTFLFRKTIFFQEYSAEIYCHCDCDEWASIMFKLPSVPPKYSAPLTCNETQRKICAKS